MAHRLSSLSGLFKFLESSRARAKEVVGTAVASRSRGNEGLMPQRFMNLALGDFTIRPAQGPGHFVFGARRKFQAGYYTAYAWLRIDAGANIDRLVFDAVSWSGSHAAEVGTVVYRIPAGNKRLIVFMLSFDIRSESEVELRLWSDGHDGAAVLDFVCAQWSGVDRYHAENETDTVSGDWAPSDTSILFALTPAAGVNRFSVVVKSLPEPLDIFVDTGRLSTSDEGALLSLPIPRSVDGLSQFAEIYVRAGLPTSSPPNHAQISDRPAPLPLAQKQMTLTIRPRTAAADCRIVGTLIDLGDPGELPRGLINLSLLPSALLSAGPNEEVPLAMRQVLLTLTCTCDARLRISYKDGEKIFALKAGKARVFVLPHQVSDSAIPSDSGFAKGADLVEIVATGSQSAAARASEVHLLKVWNDFPQSELPESGVIAYGNFVRQQNDIKLWGGGAMFPGGERAAALLRCHPWGGIAALKWRENTQLVNLYAPSEERILFTPQLEPAVLSRGSSLYLDENGLHPYLTDYFSRLRPAWLNPHGQAE